MQKAPDFEQPRCRLLVRQAGFLPSVTASGGLQPVGARPDELGAAAFDEPAAVAAVRRLLGKPSDRCCDSRAEEGGVHPDSLLFVH